MPALDNAAFGYVRFFQEIFSYFLDVFLLFLGPCLICVVFAIVLGELYAFFNFLLPLQTDHIGVTWTMHAIFAIFLAVNTYFNYIKCVTTNPGTHDSEVYKRLLAEAKAAGQLDTRRGGMEKSGGAEVRGRRMGSEAQSTSTGSWIDDDAFEWGYCRRTKLRKAPRAHYDHITKKLVLNMDHFCPWMFNVVVSLILFTFLFSFT